MLSSPVRPAPLTARSSLDDGELDPWAASDDGGGGGESSDPETIVARRPPAPTPPPIAETLDLDPALDPPDPAPRRTPSNLKLRGSPRIGGPGGPGAASSSTLRSPALPSASAPRTPASPAASAPGALGGMGKGVPRATSHPLALDELALGLRNGTLDGKIASLRLDERDDDDVSDVSRPNLRRLTSEMDRAVAESQGSSASASERGSVDLLRVAAEVEVIVHQIKQGESLPGIALRYGIELGTLRKANKMWPSDPLHLRTHLYVPLDACRPTAKGDTMVRAGGQVTIVPRRAGENGEGSSSSGASNGAGSSAAAAAHDGGVTLDIVRLPASQLRFFPGQRREPSGRHSSRSLDNEVGRSADSVRALSATERAARRQRARTHAGTFSPDDPLPPPPGKSTKRVVRLRPPRELAPAPAAGEQSLATRLSMLFSVAPPPAHPAAAAASASSPRVSSTGGSRPTSGASTPSYHPAVPAVELEMDARAVPRRTDVRPEDLRRMASAGGHIKPRKPTDKKRD
ncbi:LysM and putative peptidoglycan-binding domain-containing protein 1 [Vanrija pseudolonga]|uniref:LysM and putative peptidoglycan-binding domain-containing protein 1 n=1 Tax=Vanrija pseudolonga TaxID=143232 RepID=A0AAF0YJ34_9TREE|nr:LysM and putative peptidoglycan-binding domain-containing protein 1 [Vanrija pseudolonga]